MSADEKRDYLPEAASDPHLPALAPDRAKNASQPEFHDLRAKEGRVSEFTDGLSKTWDLRKLEDCIELFGDNGARAHKDWKDAGLFDGRPLTCIVTSVDEKKNTIYYAPSLGSA